MKSIRTLLLLLIQFFVHDNILTLAPVYLPTYANAERKVNFALWTAAVAKPETWTKSHSWQEMLNFSAYHKLVQRSGE